MLLLGFTSLLAKPSALALIAGYQKFISPHKGYSCAYNALHPNSSSCSEYGKQAISIHGVFPGYSLLQHRLEQCRQAYAALRAMPHSAGNLIIKGGTQVADDCNAACNESCKQPLAEMWEAVKHFFWQSISDLIEDFKQIIETEINEIKEQLKELWKDFVEFLTGFIPAMDSLPQPESNTTPEENDSPVPTSKANDSPLQEKEIVSGKVLPGEWTYYSFKPQTSRASFELTHLSGDIDLYIRSGEKPSLEEYDCESSRDQKSSETCHITGVNQELQIGVWGKTDGASYRMVALDGSIAGWSRETGFGRADTQIRENIVRAALNAVGSPSGQSQIPDNTVEHPWLTDIAEGDGRRMMNAISIYHTWVMQQNGGNTKDDSNKIDARMIGAFSDSNYQAKQKEDLVEQIKANYSGHVPKNDQETLSFFAIQKQCLEWAMSIAIDAGGKDVNYSGMENYTVAVARIRPGMGFYASSIPHAMLITDVKYNDNGIPTTVRVAESNYANEWVNPLGQIPWERTISEGREIPAKNYTAVNYDGQ